MRKILVVVLVAIIISVAIYSGIGAESYLLLRIGDWAMQVRLFVACLLALGLAILIWASWSIFRGIFLGAWPAAWRKSREKNLTRAAIENLALSNWAVARKELVRLANKADQPVPLVMLSAQASEAMGDFEEAKQIYAQALDEFPDWSYAIRVRICRIALVEGELDVADELLTELKNERKGDVQLQVLEIQLAEEQRDSSRLQQALIAVVKKTELRAMVAPIERRYLYSRLSERTGSPELLELFGYASMLENVPSSIVSQLAQQLAMRGHAKEAELLVRRSLNQRWDESLIAIYAELEAKSPKKQLKNAEAWLVEHSQSTELMNSLQKLALRAGDDAKADHYAAMLDNSFQADQGNSEQPLSTT